MDWTKQRDSAPPDGSKKRKRERDSDPDYVDTDKEKGPPVLVKLENGQTKLSLLANGTLKIVDSGGPVVGSPPPSLPSVTQGTPAASSKGATPRGGTTKAKKGHKKDKLKKKAGNLGASDTQGGVEDDDKHQPIQGDFSRVKVQQNQIPIHQFWTWCDQFFRNLTEEDLRFLDEKVGDEVTPYIVPALGKHYIEQWNEEDSFGETLTYPAHTQNDYLDYDEAMRDGEPSIGPLAERIISALLAEQILQKVDYTGDIGRLGENARLRTKADVMDLEERMRQELRHIGLIDEDDDSEDIDDDEICRELRAKQAELRELVQTNAKRKQQLKERAVKWMAWQEYNAVLDDTNKSVVEAFKKRFAKPDKKKGKKLAPSEYHVIPDNVVELRQRLLREMSTFFPHDKFTIPQESIYRDSDEPLPKRQKV
ncbi:Transcriptional regulator [Borealophlyctis nickersoniae]|nr:Transcriptional regulator [Borealophlyctis nickersoniae]